MTTSLVSRRYRARLDPPAPRPTRPRGCGSGRRGGTMISVDSDDSECSSVSPAPAEPPACDTLWEEIMQQVVEGGPFDTVPMDSTLCYPNRARDLVPGEEQTPTVTATYGPPDRLPPPSLKCACSRRVRHQTRPGEVALWPTY